MNSERLTVLVLSFCALSDTLALWMYAVRTAGPPGECRRRVGPVSRAAAAKADLQAGWSKLHPPRRFYCGVQVRTRSIFMLAL